jgi:hypothetical protein
MRLLNTILTVALLAPCVASARGPQPEPPTHPASFSAQWRDSGRVVTPIAEAPSRPIRRLTGGMPVLKAPGAARPTPLTGDAPRALPAVMKLRLVQR